MFKATFMLVISSFSIVGVYVTTANGMPTPTDPSIGLAKKPFQPMFPQNFMLAQPQYGAGGMLLGPQKLGVKTSITFGPGKLEDAAKDDDKDDFGPNDPIKDSETFNEDGSNHNSPKFKPRDKNKVRIICDKLSKRNDQLMANNKNVRIKIVTYEEVKNFVDSTMKNEMMVKKRLIATLTIIKGGLGNQLEQLQEVVKKINDTFVAIMAVDMQLKKNANDIVGGIKAVEDSLKKQTEPKRKAEAKLKIDEDSVDGLWKKASTDLVASDESLKAVENILSKTKGQGGTNNAPTPTTTQQKRGKDIGEKGGGEKKSNDIEQMLLKNFAS